MVSMVHLAKINRWIIINDQDMAFSHLNSAFMHAWFGK